MELVVRAPPDGYTLLLASNGAIATSKFIYPNLTFDPISDLMPVSGWFKVDNVLLVKADSPLRSIVDVVAAARRDPGGVTYGSAGHGSTLHLMGEMLQFRTGIRMAHVAYRGGAAAMIDLIAGNIASAFDSLPSALPQIQGGKVRALAVCSAKRSPFLPDVPTMMEQGIQDFNEYSWGGVFAPLKTPGAIIDQLAGAIMDASRNSAVQARMASSGAELIAGSPAELRALVRDEAARWEPVIRSAKIVAN
jgi:tripartite-type tricarboxylate transporter receptor subunit TctC